MKQMKRRIAIYLALMLGVSGAAPSYVPGFGYELVRAEGEEVSGYTVSFNNGYDDTEDISVNVASDNKTTLESVAPTLKERDGYRFKGWLNGQTAWDISKNAVEGNMTLTADWAKQVTVKFELNGGAASGDEALLNQTVDEGTPVQNPGDPTKENNEFAGWFKEGESTAWNFGDNVGESMTLTASWNAVEQPEAPKVCIILLSANGDNVTGIPEQVINVSENEKVGDKLPTPEREGYTFEGWHEETVDGTLWTSETVVTKDVTLVAKWIENVQKQKFTVSFNVNGVITEKKVDEGAVVAEPEKPENSVSANWIFTGWYNGNTKWDFKTPVTGNMTLEARWRAPETFTVKFMNDTNLVLSVNVEEGQTVPTASVPNNPTKAGYKFLGWFVGDKEWNKTEPVTASLEITAKWAQLFTVSFDTTISGQSEPEQEVADGDTATEPTTKPAKEGYVFLGWSATNKADDLWSFSSPVKNDMTLTAQWQERKAGMFYVVFDADNGTAASTVEVASGNAVDEPSAPTKAGYTFKWWYKDGGADTVSWNFSASVNADMTLKAKWEQNAVDPGPSETTYTVIFTVEGVTTASQNVVSGNKVTKPADPTRDGFTFVGWYNGDVAWDFNTPVTGNLTLTAKWTDVVSCNHTWDKGTVTVSADCMNTGIMTYTCTKCGATDPRIIPVNGEHKWDAGKVTQSANCVTEGKMAYTCTVCGSTKEEVLSINASQHRWDDGVVTTSANCTQKGVKTFTCLDCKKATKTEEIEALGHKWNEGTVTKEPTCTEEGKKTVSCQNCTETKEEAIPATGHKWDEGKVTKAATCTEDGVKEFTCQSCKETKTEAIKAAGHKYGAYKVTRAATVLKAGEKVRTCSVCGATQKATIAKLAPTIKLSATNVTLRVGKATTIKVTGLAKGDAVKSWKSSNTKVAKVSAKGKITAQKKTGKATVTVTLKSGKKATVKVTVQKKEVKTTKITGVAKKATLKVGKKLTFKPVLKPATSTQKITYTTSNKKVATVNAKGVITAKKAGKAKITVKSGSKKVVMTVTVKKK